MHHMEKKKNNTYATKKKIIICQERCLGAKYSTSWSKVFPYTY